MKTVARFSSVGQVKVPVARSVWSGNSGPVTPLAQVAMLGINFPTLLVNHLAAIQIRMDAKLVCHKLDGPATPLVQVAILDMNLLAPLVRLLLAQQVLVLDARRVWHRNSGPVRPIATVAMLGTPCFQTTRVKHSNVKQTIVKVVCRRNSGQVISIVIDAILDIKRLDMYVSCGIVRLVMVLHVHHVWHNAPELVQALVRPATKVITCLAVHVRNVGPIALRAAVVQTAPSVDTEHSYTTKFASHHVQHPTLA